ncbi:pentapeptide repeat-containing protein, partial [Nocardia grenadensis]
DFHGARLQRVTFSGADLRRVDFSGCTFEAEMARRASTLSGVSQNSTQRVRRDSLPCGGVLRSSARSLRYVAPEPGRTPTREVDNSE